MIAKYHTYICVRVCVHARIPNIIKNLCVCWEGCQLKLENFICVVQVVSPLGGRLLVKVGEFHSYRDILKLISTRQVCCISSVP